MLLADVLDLVLPTRCAGCSRPGAALCARCGAPLRLGPVPVRPDPPPAGFPQCHAAAAYGGAVRAALIAYKERGRRDLRRPLGTALAMSALAGVSAAGPTAIGSRARPVVLVPVPSRRRAVRQRGEDTTRALAGEAVRWLRRAGIDALAMPVLRLCRATCDSAGLDAGSRAVNISGAMTARRPVDPTSVLVVVDDLLTTGATLTEAARALAAAGRPVTAAAVIAATSRRGVGFGAGAG